MPLDESFESAAEDIDTLFGMSMAEAASAGVHFLQGAVTGTLSYTWSQMRALPDFFRLIKRDEQARAVIRDTGHIALDAAAIVGVNAANQYLQTMLENANSDDASLPLSMTLLMSAWLLTAVVFMWKTRQKVKIGVRSAVLLTQHSGVFNKATQDEPVRKAFSNEVCEDCTTLRHYKGEFRDLLIYYGQQYVIDSYVRQLPYGGNIVATLLTALLRGQLVISSRLANEGICERHRAVYFREYIELCFSMGLTVEATSELLALAIETTTGVPRAEYSGTIKNLITVYLIGVSHLMDLPPAVKNTNRYYDPLTASRALGGEMMEVLIPGIKARAPVWADYFKSDEPSIDFLALLQKSIKIYSNPDNQRIMIYFLPNMLLGLKPFVNDSVVAHHWKPIRMSLIGTLDLIDAYVKDYTSGTTGAALGVIQKMSGGTALSKGVSWYFGISDKVAKQLVDFFRSPAYKEWSLRIRERLVQIKVKEGIEVDDYNTLQLLALTQPSEQTRSAHLNALTAPLRREQDRSSKLFMDEEDLVSHQKERIPTDELSKNLKRILDGTKAGLANYKQGLLALDDIGEKRRDVYLGLLRLLEEKPIAYQLLICYALNQNTGKDAGRNLWHTVQKNIDKQGFSLSTYMWELKTYLEARFNCDSLLKQGSTSSQLIEQINLLANHAHKKDMYRKMSELATSIMEQLPIDEGLNQDEPFKVAAML
jgi:hypothetical protein